ncbi:MAG: type II secretion system F family protein [Candidatus Omnitrophica bacterium]|nr:type II secretion system F family protein [Candidatus Omnitrophota bacterium]
MEFEYSARHIENGETITGVMEVPSEDALKDYLRKDGFFPLTLRERKPAPFTRDRNLQNAKHIKTKELVFFTRQLASTLKAGILLTEALDVVGTSLRNSHFSKVIANIRQDINSGRDFTSALKEYPRIFDHMFITIITVGESSGKLVTSLADLAKYLEDMDEVREKVKTGLTYPIFLISFTIIILACVVVFFIPKFKEMFSNTGQDLPWLTQVTLNICDYVSVNIFPILGGMTFLLILLKLSLRIKKVQDFVEELKLRIPFVGPEILQKFLISKFCRTLGMLFSAGINMATTLSISSFIFPNPSYRKAIEKIREQVIGGAALSDAIYQQKMFPPLVGKMILIGEKTGSYSDMLLRTASYYDEQISHDIKRLLTLFEPIMIIVAGIFIAFIVVSIYLPILNLITVIEY